MITIRLYRYGIDITNATLQTKAYELGIEKAVSEMSQMEKMQLRMLSILEQSKIAYGDLANTINSPSNMIRQFTNNLKEAGMILGQLFIPLLQKVLPILNGVMIALKRLLVAVANFFGIKLDLSGFGQGFSGLEENVDGVGDSLDDATNSAKKFKKQLAGFDELENLSSETGKSKSGVGGAGIDLTDEILKATAEYEKAFADAMARMENDAQKWADRIVEFFTTGNVGAKISKVLTDALNSIDWNSVYAVARDFGTGLASFLNSLITPDLFGAVGRTIAGVLNTAIYTALSFGKEFDWKNFGNSLATGVNEFFRTFDAKSLAEAINTWIKGALDLVITFFKKTDFEAIGKKIGEFIVTLDFTEIAAKLASAIWEVIKSGFELIGGMFEEAPLETALLGAFALLKFTGIGSLVAGKIATALAAKLGLSGTFTSVGSVFVTGLGGALTSALSAMGGISGLLTLDVTAIAGTAGAASLGITVATGVIGGVASALAGWHFGQFLYEKLTGETIDMSWEEQFYEIFRSFADGTWKDAIKMMLDDVVSAIFNWDTAFSFFDLAGEWFSDMTVAFEERDWGRLGLDIIRGILTGFVGALSLIFEPIADLFATIIDAICQVFGIHSPAKEMEPMGEYILLGIVEGFVATFDAFTDSMGDFFDNYVKPWFTFDKWMSVLSNIGDAFSDTFNSIKNTVGGIIQDLVNTINQFFDNVMSKASGLSGGLGGAIGGIVGNNSRISIPQFATGGFPQQYSLFMAGENGIPEIAGTVGGKTAVAGGAEITGIRQEIRATANEEMALLRQQNALLQAILEKEFGISQDALFSSVRNSANDYHRRTGNFAFNI